MLLSASSACRYWQRLRQQRPSRRRTWQHGTEAKLRSNTRGLKDGTLSRGASFDGEVPSADAAMSLHDLPRGALVLEAQPAMALIVPVECLHKLRPMSGALGHRSERHAIITQY